MPDDTQKTQSDKQEETGSTPQPINAPPPPNTQGQASTITQTTNDSPASAVQASNNNGKSEGKPPSQKVVTSSQVPKKYGGKKVIATIFGVLLLVAAVAAGVFLVQQQAELRERAASGKECSHSPDCVLLENPGNSGSRSFGRIIQYIDITAKDFHRYNPGETNDGCYHVIIQDNNLSWNRVGEGPNCKDISNIQVWLGEEKEEEINWSIKQICDGIEIGVSKDHDGFTTKADFSPSGSPGTWQNEQSWQVNSGGSNTYSFNFEPIPTSGWWVRARVIYKDKQVAVIEEPILDCTTPTPTYTPTPTTPELSAQCHDIKIYDADWNLLSPSQLESLREGDSLRLAVEGSANLGFFDKARFTVNGNTLPETTNKKPGSDQFYSEYQIPEGTTTFNINAQIHHSTLGWF
jgi:hypothetical protein